MTKRFHVTAIALAGVLVVMAGQLASAQDFRKDLAKGIIQSLGPEAMRAVIHTMAQEFAASPDLRKQVIQSMGPDALKALVSSISQEFVQHPELRKNLVQSLPSDTLEPASPKVESGPAKTEPAVTRVAAKGPTRGTQADQPSEQEVAPRMPLPRSFSGALGPVVMITHPSNSMNELTIDQVRKIVSGECTNWSQLGGPDLPVKVYVVGSAPATLKNILGATLASNASRLPFVSFIVPNVAQDKGAVGFLQTVNNEQADFINGHTAIKVVAVTTSDSKAAAIPPRPSTAGGDVSLRIMTSRLGTGS
jgi:ABC-type phosphate transport system substrate-binding protein